MGRTIQAIAPREVCDFLKQAQEEGHNLSSIENTIKLARSEKKPKVATWIKNNPLAYGVGYWGEFIPEDITVEQGEPEGEPAKNNLEEKPKRKRKRIPLQEDKNE